MLRFNLVICIVAFSIFNFSVTFSQGFAQRGNERMQAAKKIKLLEILDLSDADAEKFLIKYTASEKLIMEKNEQLRNVSSELIEYLDKSPNGKELSDKTNKVIQAQKEMHEAMESRINSIRQILSEQNFAKFLAFEIEFSHRLKRFMNNPNSNEPNPDKPRNMKRKR